MPDRSNAQLVFSIVKWRNLKVDKTMKHPFASITLILLLSLPVFGGAGMHGALTVSSPNVILNEATTLTANAVAGATMISVSNSTLNANSRFTGNLATGELLLLIQMQGASINSTDTTSINWGAVTNLNNAGNFELVEVAAVTNPTTIQLVSPLLNSYTASGKVQVIRVPRYSQFTLGATGSLTANSWDGSTGGVVVIEVGQDAVLSGTIDVTGKGFRGGVIDSTSDNPGNHIKYATKLKGSGAEKGEGIAGAVSAYDLLGGRYGRGAAANGGGGGNSHNCGGGGGANGSNGATWNGQGVPDTSGGLPANRWSIAWNRESTGFAANWTSGGGRGGYSYSNRNRDANSEGPGSPGWSGDDRFNCGGIGGRSVSSSRGRMFLGGGGGAGDGNDGYQTGGAAGGGIVYFVIRGNLSGNGIVTANGASAVSSLGKDAPGGGGGGGTVFMNVLGTVTATLAINAKGGNGGNQSIGAVNEAEGPGGGGGGGAVFLSKNGPWLANVLGGLNGTTNSAALTEFLPNGATSGSAGFVDYAATLPIELIDFAAFAVDHSIEVRWSTASESNNDYFVLEKSTDGNDFQQISRIRGAGTSSALHHYSFIDNDPAAGANYFKLTQFDFDGNYRTYGPVVCRPPNKTKGFQLTGLSPVPFIDHLKIEFYAESQQLLEISLCDILGARILEKKLPATKGFNKYYLDELPDLPAGNYLLHIYSADELLKTVRLVK